MEAEAKTTIVRTYQVLEPDEMQAMVKDYIRRIEQDMFLAELRLMEYKAVENLARGNENANALRQAIEGRDMQMYALQEFEVRLSRLRSLSFAPEA